MKPIPFLGGLLALGPLFAGCQSFQLDFGAAGDSMPLTGLERSLEPGPVQPAWRRVLEERSVYRDDRHQIGGVAYDAFRDRVAVGTTDGWFHCLRASDGGPVWRVDLGSGGGGRPVFARGLLYLGTDDGRVLALDVGNGRKIWSYRVQGAISRAPLIVGDLLYFVDGENAIYALDAATGAWRWQYRREPPAEFALVGEARPLVADGKVFVGFSDGMVVALGAADGGVLWERDIAPEHERFQDVDATPALVAGRLYAASAAAGVAVLDPATGEVEETLPVSGVTDLIAVDDDVVAAVDDGRLVRIRGRDGAVRWRTDFGRGSGAPGEPVQVGGWTLVPFSKGGVHVVETGSGRPVHHFAPGNGIHGPLTAGRDGAVFLLSDGGILYALKPQAG